MAPPSDEAAAVAAEGAGDEDGGDCGEEGATWEEEDDYMNETPGRLCCLSCHGNSRWAVIVAMAMAGVVSWQLQMHCGGCYDIEVI